MQYGFEILSILFILSKTLLRENHDANNFSKFH
jgi:hypothetical protein